jgi:glycosyltransferase involved in cell wall biosynthesis
VPDRFAIAQVTPYPWESDHEVNRYVRELSDELCRRGHRVVVIAPSQSPALVRESRNAIRAAADNPRALLQQSGRGGPRVIAAGDVIGASSGRRRRPALPIDVARTIEEALTVTPWDFVHVHEPFAPSAASAALRHSRALNVGSFHAPAEPVVSAQLARRVVELFFGRLDARTTSYEATRELMQRFFPGDYRVILPGASGDGRDRRAASERPLRIAFAAREERTAGRLFVRALRRLPDGLPWGATVVGGREGIALAAVRRELRERIRFDAAGGFASADVAVFASTGTTPAPGALLDAIAAGAVPVAARLPVYEELVGDGERGLLFEPGDADTLAAQLERLARDRELRERLRDAAADLRARLTWGRVADEVEALYRELAGRRHDGAPTPELRARLAKRGLIDVDLHMHTDHTPDCATPVEVLLATAREQRLGAIAVTDHNEIAGAHEARAKADGVKVIVAEEVKTADQGEVIGLFIEEKIPRGLTLQETIAEIKRQGGLVYVPHPFDRLHAVPDYEHMLAVLDDIDAIEVFNPRVAFKPFNEEAVRFAAKYRIAAGAGSDAHVPQGLGSVRIRMRDFDGPEEFIASLRDADIIRNPKSLLYVQALKFLQTKATPAPARRAARERKVKRALRAGDGQRKS